MATKSPTVTSRPRNLARPVGLLPRTYSRLFESRTSTTPSAASRSDSGWIVIGAPAAGIPQTFQRIIFLLRSLPLALQLLLRNATNSFGFILSHRAGGHPS